MRQHRGPAALGGLPPSDGAAFVPGRPRCRLSALRAVRAALAAAGIRRRHAWQCAGELASPSAPPIHPTIAQQTHTEPCRPAHLQRPAAPGCATAAAPAPPAAAAAVPGTPPPLPPLPLQLPLALLQPAEAGLARPPPSAGIWVPLLLPLLPAALPLPGTPAAARPAAAAGCWPRPPRRRPAAAPAKTAGPGPQAAPAAPLPRVTWHARRSRRAPPLIGRGRWRLGRGGRRRAGAGEQLADEQAQEPAAHRFMQCHCTHSLLCKDSHACPPACTAYR